jgi:hypothetical protein
MKKFIIVFSLVSLINIAFASRDETDSNYPKSADDQRWDSFGSVLGEKGGVIYESNPNSNSSGGKKGSSPTHMMAVNPYLWQATIDVVSFMPIQVSDASGGVITTDWYEDPDFPGTRYRLNILIKAVELHVNNLKVNVFKQVLQEGVWREVKPSKEIATDLEDKILTKARELKLAQEQ